MVKVHIGKKIKEVVEKSHYSVADFAELINLTRDGAYKIFNKEIIDTDQLNKISRVLNHDFFKHFSHDLAVIREPKDTFGYATKEDMLAILRMIEKLTKKVDELQQHLPKKKVAVKKTYQSKKSKA